MESDATQSEIVPSLHGLSRGNQVDGLPRASTFLWPNDLSIEDFSKFVNSFDIGVFF